MEHHEILLTNDQLRTIDFVFTLFENNIPNMIRNAGGLSDTMARFELVFNKAHALGNFFKTILEEDGKGGDDETT